MLKYSLCAPIKMIGVWDTVGSIGVPFGNMRGISSSTLGFFHTGLRLSIENGYHALAIDEHRRAFPPTFWTVRKPRDPNATVAKPRPISSVEQRWFIGAHGNIGGGYPSDVLAQLPLQWLMRKASSHGLAFKNEVGLDGEIAEFSNRRFISRVYVGRVFAVQLEATQSNRSSSRRKGRRHPYSHKRDHRCFSFRTLEGRTRLQTNQFGNMGSRQEDRSRHDNAFRAGGRSFYGRAGLIWQGKR